jgi:predicted ribosome quality control (RQC) complex YloA/Tae2 family protein
MTPLSSLLGARIQRIDAPQDALLSLAIASPGQREVLVFCFASGSQGVGSVAERPHGRAADSFVQKLRKELEGGRIAEFPQRAENCLELVVQRADLQRVLRCEFNPPRITLWDCETHLLASHLPGSPSASRSAVRWPESVEELRARGPELLAQHAEYGVEQQRSLLERAVRTAQRRLERRLSALAEDAARAERAVPLRARAQLLLANLHAVTRGAARVQLRDYTLDPPALVEVELDPSQSLHQQVEIWFKQARRFERGAELAQTRAQLTRRELEQLSELRANLELADLDSLESLAHVARALGVRGVNPSVRKLAPGKTQPQRHKPYREFRGRGERAILVGKRAEDNDTLTREHARPQDLWMHARDITGAHVVVPLSRNETCPQELLLDAAQLAVHFSDARGESQADVCHTAKRYVRKPRGAPPGMVQLDKEKVLHLHSDPVRLARLLASEVQD